MVEFIIKGEIEEDFNLHANQWQDALCPAGMECIQPKGFGISHLDIIVCRREALPVRDSI